MQVDEGSFHQETDLTFPTQLLNSSKVALENRFESQIQDLSLPFTQLPNKNEDQQTTDVLSSSTNSWSIQTTSAIPFEAISTAGAVHPTSAVPEFESSTSELSSLRGSTSLIIANISSIANEVSMPTEFTQIATEASQNVEAMERSSTSSSADPFLLSSLDPSPDASSTNTYEPVSWSTSTPSIYADTTSVYSPFNAESTIIEATFTSREQSRTTIPTLQWLNPTFDEVFSIPIESLTRTSSIPMTNTDESNDSPTSFWPHFFSVSEPSSSRPVDIETLLTVSSSTERAASIRTETVEVAWTLDDVSYETTSVNTEFYSTVETLVRSTEKLDISSSPDFSLLKASTDLSWDTTSEAIAVTEEPDATTFSVSQQQTTSAQDSVITTEDPVNTSDSGTSSFEGSALEFNLIELSTSESVTVDTIEPAENASSATAFGVQSSIQSETTVMTTPVNAMQTDEITPTNLASIETTFESNFVSTVAELSSSSSVTDEAGTENPLSTVTVETSSSSSSTAIPTATSEFELITVSKSAESSEGTAVNDLFTVNNGISSTISHIQNTKELASTEMSTTSFSVGEDIFVSQEMTVTESANNGHSTDYYPSSSTSDSFSQSTENLITNESTSEFPFSDLSTEREFTSLMDTDDVENPKWTISTQLPTTQQESETSSVLDNGRADDEDSYCDPNLINCSLETGHVQQHPVSDDTTTQAPIILVHLNVSLNQSDIPQFFNVQNWITGLCKTMAILSDGNRTIESSLPSDKLCQAVGNSSRLLQMIFCPPSSSQQNIINDDSKIVQHIVQLIPAIVANVSQSFPDVDDESITALPVTEESKVSQTIVGISESSIRLPAVTEEPSELQLNLTDNTVTESESNIDIEPKRLNLTTFLRGVKTDLSSAIKEYINKILFHDKDAQNKLLANIENVQDNSDDASVPCDYSTTVNPSAGESNKPTLRNSLLDLNRHSGMNINIPVVLSPQRQWRTIPPSNPILFRSAKLPLALALKKKIQNLK